MVSQVRGRGWETQHLFMWVLREQNLFLIIPQEIKDLHVNGLLREIFNPSKRAYLKP